MRARLIWILVGLGVVVVLAAGGAAAARAMGAFDDDDAKLTGTSADLAANAAARAVRGVKVVHVERDDDNAFEVEVMRSDGTTVDVDVNAAYEVVAVDAAENPAAAEDEEDDADDETDDAGEPDDDADEALDD